MEFEVNRIINKDGICTYLDADVQEAAFILTCYGFDLENFDTFLESLPKSERLTQFLEWRSHAIHSILTFNESAAEAWCCALNASRLEYIKSKTLTPLADYGKTAKEKSSEGGKTAGERFQPLRDRAVELVKNHPYQFPSKRNAALYIKNEILDLSEKSRTSLIRTTSRDHHQTLD